MHSELNIKSPIIFILLLGFSLCIKGQISSKLSYNKVDKSVSITLENLTESTFRLCNPLDSLSPQDLTYFTVKYLGKQRGIVYSYRVPLSMSIGGEEGKGTFISPREKKSFRIVLRPETTNVIYYVQIGAHIEVKNISGLQNTETGLHKNLFIKEISETYPISETILK